MLVCDVEVVEVVEAGVAGAGEHLAVRLHELLETLHGGAGQPSSSRPTSWGCQSRRVRASPVARRGRHLDSTRPRGVGLASRAALASTQAVLPGCSAVRRKAQTIERSAATRSGFSSLVSPAS